MSKLQTILLDCEYFPCIQWYRDFINNENIYLEQFEYFERASLRNRCYVAGPNGRQSLSVPLEGGRNQRMRMKDVKISYNENWRAQNYRTLLACYNRSPYFEFYEREFNQFYATKFDFLIDLNLASIKLINQLLSIQKQFAMTTDYEKNPPIEVMDYRKRYTAINSCENIDLVYLQPFNDRNGFVAGLSMIDLLFCTGKQAVSLLKNR